MSPRGEAKWSVVWSAVGTRRGLHCRNVGKMGIDGDRWGWMGMDGDGDGDRDRDGVNGRVMDELMVMESDQWKMT